MKPHEARKWAYENLIPFYSYEELARMADDDLADLVDYYILS
ncbi:hypothetical protein SEA_TWEETY19_48 [Arthrobacter phage Tweety19]|uniref:Uncharacterized protein n=1 Tax=Arthrobacter phage Tweety19 TaxID=2768133 RepID=A0A7G9W244_9CAUD|nr:hypothetical protein PQE19_gp61 [Arthrobacter phage Tweety19]QNO12707.1 hypothetical protein SEA_TWEETY19_48 [Arthrobacter phage Tweety19]